MSLRLCVLCVFRLFVHNQKVFGQAFGGVGEGGFVPVFHKQNEIFDYRIDFQGLGQVFARYEIVFDAGGCKFGEFAPQIVEESVLALRKQNGVNKRFFVVQVIKNVRDKVLVVEYGGF